MPSIFQNFQSQLSDDDNNARAFNLARRLTARNEPDLLQEDLFDDNKNESGSYSSDYCKMIAAKINSQSDFPMECQQYKEAVTQLQRRNSERKQAFAGMSPGEAIDAMRAKDEGHLSSAQIKRRMTSRKNGRFY